jgi:ribose 5-phosphate isomerase B
MKIALGTDHRGANLGRALARHLRDAGHAVEVVGELTEEPTDYPDVSYGVARAVADGGAERGVLICGTGIGACIAANKVTGVRAALVQTLETAELSRRHNDANVLCLPGDTVAPAEAAEITDRWLAAPFDGGRHARRVDKITAIERGEDPARGTVPIS